MQRSNEQSRSLCLFVSGCGLVKMKTMKCLLQGNAVDRWRSVWIEACMVLPQPGQGWWPAPCMSVSIVVKRC